MRQMFNRQQFAASTLVSTGLARLSRQRHAGEACILTFHGLLAPGEANDLLDPGAHTSVELFHDLCSHLAKSYQVLPLAEIATTLLSGKKFPERIVGLSFDDGYESNHRLAFPILREFGLRATVFLCTGFIDGAVEPWFLRLERMLMHATAPEIYIRLGSTSLWVPIKTRQERADALSVLLRSFKCLPQSAVDDHLDRLEAVLDPGSHGIPAPLRPMNWAQAREMRDSGLVTFGAHTRRHPILGRCTSEVARDEILASRDRVAAELGRAPTLFAYPNGQDDDYSTETQRLLREAGFEAAFTMVPGFARPETGHYQLPRYGSPESLQQAEATVSGAFEYFKAWRLRLRRAFAA